MSDERDPLLTDMGRPDQQFREGLVAGELRYQRCESCAKAVFYPRVACPHCGSPALRFEVSAGSGTVYSTTAIRQRDQPSYAVTMVDLDEGFRMMSTVQHIAAEDVRIGMRVGLRFDSDAAGDPRAVFVPQDVL